MWHIPFGDVAIKKLCKIMQKGLKISAGSAALTAPASAHSSCVCPIARHVLITPDNKNYKSPSSFIALVADEKNQEENAVLPCR